MQKEFQQLKQAIRNWIKVNDGNVCFIGSFVSFDQKKIDKNKDDVVRDDIILGYGGKKEVKISLDVLVKQLKKDKEKFINW